MKRKQVALIIETSNSYARGLLHGIRTYIREHQNWTITIREHSRGKPDAEWWSKWRGDGIIARIENNYIRDIITRLDLPTIDVSAARLIKDLPWVETNDLDIAQLAAEHLIGCGFKNFAYYGDPYFNWSNWRFEAFSERLIQESYACEAYMNSLVSDKSVQSQKNQEQLIEWLKKLRKPVGIMACYDIYGLHLLEACRLADIAVPDQVSIIGVDNDELLCDLADPPLSSVIPDTHQTGYVAASLLDRLFSNQPISTKAHLISPIGIAKRLSTDVLAIEDDIVAKAVRFIRDNACDNIKVNDILKVVPLSRRALEGRFRKLLRRTPHEEILRVKLSRVKQLLKETDLSLSTIAERTGFDHVEYLSAMFKKHTGVPPSQYRVNS